MAVDGLSLDRSGNLWVTYSTGPDYQSDLAGGDPKPHSCGNEIVVVHAATQRASVYLRTGNNVLIRGAAVSPDGRRLAYDESGCATGYFNDYLRITATRTGRTWTIGRDLGRCHWITDPAWTFDSRALLLAYAPHVGRPYTGSQGTCGGMGTERLVEVAPAAQPGLTGHGASAPRGCEISSVAPTAGGGMLAVEACGHADHTLGRARLAILDARFRLVRQLSLGRCTDGNDLSTARTGRGTLVSAYLFCNPPGRPQPITRLWQYAGGKLRQIASQPGGTLAYAYLTW